MISARIADSPLPRLLESFIEVEIARNLDLERMATLRGPAVPLSDIGAGIGVIDRRAQPVALDHRARTLGKARRGAGAEPIADDDVWSLPRRIAGALQRRHRMHIEQQRLSFPPHG
jgi:hypothetical protein